MDHMAQWGWSSPFHSDQSLMGDGPNEGHEASEGHGKVNSGYRITTGEDSEPDYDDPVKSTEEVPDYEIDDEAPDYDGESDTGGERSPSTIVQIQTDLEGPDPDYGPGLLVVVEKDSSEGVPSTSNKPEDSATSGFESLSSSETFKDETPNEHFEDELDTISVRTMDPDSLRIRTGLRTWRRGVAPLLVQGANTIRLRRKEVEAMMAEEKAEAEVEGMQRPRSKADFTIFIDEKKKKSLAVGVEESNRQKRKRRRAEKWKHFRSRLKDLSGIFALWSTTFKEIEGHFGGATVSYFRFVKWLLLVNLLSSLVITCSTLLPQVLLPPDNFNDTVNCSAYSYPTTSATPTDANYTLEPEGTLSPSPETTTYETSDPWKTTEVGNSSSSSEVIDYRGEIGVREACMCTDIYLSGIKSTDGREWYMIILDILQGTEWMELSVLFLGYYFDKPLYMSSLAFIFSILICFAIILWLIVLYISSALRANISESPGANKQRYSEHVFGCWNHHLMNEEAAGRKKKQFYNAIRSELQKDVEKKEKEQRSRGKRFGIFVLRLIVAILIAALIGAAGFFLYLLVTKFVPELRDIKIEDDVLQEFFNLLLQYLPSMALTFINTVLPLCFTIIIKLAILTAETEFAVLLVLMVFTRLSSIAFLVITLFIQIYGCQIYACHTCPEIPCWENRLGQHMYTLAIIDFLTVFFTFLVTITFGRCCCYRPKKQQTNGGETEEKDGGHEFDVSAEVLSAVYTQTICWIGAFFCPLILPITAVKLFIFFYLKKKSLFCCCVPSSRINRASRFNFFFMIVTLISLVICYFVVTFAIGWLHPSQGCSPFRVYSEADFYMYRSFTFVSQRWSDAAQDFIHFISSAAFYVIISIASIFFICLFSVMASRNRKIARQLEQQILLESQDKLFLYRRAQEAYLRNELDD